MPVASIIVIQSVVPLTLDCFASLAMTNDETRTKAVGMALHCEERSDEATRVGGTETGLLRSQ